MTKRIIALDIGEKRIGVALSDPLGITAQPLETYRRKTRRADIEYLGGLCQSKGAELIVCGLPLNMDGSEGFQAEYTRAFAQELEASCGLKVEFVDERLTTALARRALIEGGVRRQERKNSVDQLAAAHILSTYLDKNRHVN